MIFGTPDKWLTPIVGGGMGGLTGITIGNIRRYQNCWMSMKINFYRYKIIKTIEKCPVEYWRYGQLKVYIDTQLSDLMEDYTL